MCPLQMYKCIPRHCLPRATWAAGTEKDQRGRKGTPRRSYYLFCLFLNKKPDKQFLGFELCKSILCCHPLTGTHSPFFQGECRCKARNVSHRNSQTLQWEQWGIHQAASTLSRMMAASWFWFIYPIYLRAFMLCLFVYSFLLGSKHPHVPESVGTDMASLGIRLALWDNSKVIQSAPCRVKSSQSGNPQKCGLCSVCCFHP